MERTSSHIHKHKISYSAAEILGKVIRFFLLVIFENTHQSFVSFSSIFLENIYATLPRTQRGQPIVLGGDPKGKNFLYCNGNSVIIRNIDVS